MLDFRQHVFQTCSQMSLYFFPSRKKIRYTADTKEPSPTAGVELEMDYQTSPSNRQLHPSHSHPPQ